MAAFSSYQQPHPHAFVFDSSELINMDEPNLFSQFYYPSSSPPPPNPKFPTLHEHQEMIINNNNNNSSVDDDLNNEPSNNNSAVTKNQLSSPTPTVSSTEQQVTQSTVTTTTTNHMNNKRKSTTNNASSSSFNSAQSKDPSEVKSKKQKKNPKAKNEKKATEVEEAPKDYIHVRARRGQATDSHSLAERVRREKISERMKTLQELVPGCDKVTGKALMLDEIINYVQSLQNQVEFLSMKLASVNPMFYDYGMDLDNTFMVRPDQRLNGSTAAPAPASASASTPAVVPHIYDTTANAFASNNNNNNNNYPILDSQLLQLQQGQRPNNALIISQDNGNSTLMWDGDVEEDQKQKFLNPSAFTNNLCSFH